MNNFSVKTKLMAFVTIFLLAEFGKAEVEEKSCKDVRRDIISKQISGLSKCTKTMQLSDERDFTCILKCTLEKTGLFNEEGQIIQTTWDSYLLDNFPPSMSDKANSTFLPCFPKSVVEFDKTDPFCKDYEPILTCLQSKFSSNPREQ